MFLFFLTSKRTFSAAESFAYDMKVRERDRLAYNYFSKKDEQILYAILKKKIEFFPKTPTAHWRDLKTTHTIPRSEQ